MSKVLIEQFTNHLRESGKSYSTIIAYSKDLEQLHQHTQKDLHQLTQPEIASAIKSLQEDYGFTPKTISRKINSFRTFYRYLQGLGQITESPAVNLIHPRVTSRPPRVLTPVEYLALREVSRSNARLFTMIELMLQTGLRIGELSRLKVKHAKLHKTGGFLHIEPYSTIPERMIPLTNRAHQLMNDYLQNLPANPEEQPLFPTRDGKHIIIRNIRSSIDRAMVKAGIEDACVNDLRNTFIVSQLQAGVPMDVVSGTVGHRSKATTQKYLDLLEADYKPNGDSKLVDV